MIKRDFHGWTTDAAIQEMHNIIGGVRNNDQPEFVEIITGHGSIRDAILNLLIDYKIDAEYQWRNDGVIVVTIE